PAPSCHRSATRPIFRISAFTAGQPVVVIPDGRTKYRAASESFGVELRVNDVVGIRFLPAPSLDRLNLPTDLHQSLRQRRQITSRTIRVIQRPRNPLPSQPQLAQR